MSLLVHSVLAVYCLPTHGVGQDFQRNLICRMFPVDGVSTYLALTFGTLLSSQGTDASFVPVSPGSPGASLRCFTLYQGFSGLSNHRFSAGMQKLAIRESRSRL